MNFGQALTGSLAALGNLATGTISFREPAAAFWEVARSRPRLARWHGSELRRAWQGGRRLGDTTGTHPALKYLACVRRSTAAGKEALTEARRRSLTKKEQEDELHALSLHPAWVVSKKLLARHMFIYGSVGSGKSVILKHLLEQTVRLKRKFHLRHQRGLYVHFKHPVIVCLRQTQLDLGRWPGRSDANQAAAFSKASSPEEGSGAFWASAASLAGRVRARTPGHEGQELGWAELARWLPAQPDPCPKRFQSTIPAPPRSSNPDSNTTSSCMAVLANGTAVIRRLALAWPERKPDRMFSMLDWIKDSYEGRKQVIVQSGPDEVLARSYISAMINCAVPEIIGPSLPDDEAGRFWASSSTNSLPPASSTSSRCWPWAGRKAWWPAWPCRTGAKSRRSTVTRRLRRFLGWSAHTSCVSSRWARPGKNLPEPRQAHRGLADPRRKATVHEVESRCSAGAAH